jgi:S1-C subfamily serine protease/regulator of sirC expression with transglutaminase-like and TPR domain
MFLKHKNRVPFLLSIISIIICSGVVNGQEIDDLNLSKLSTLQLAKQEAEDFENLVKLIKPSIVVVESVDRIGREGGRGTGFVVSANGIIATNFHVIGEHRDFKIRFANGNSFSPKEILAIDRENDLALIKIDASDLPTLQLGDSDQITPGQSVFSIGNPLGYSHSVTRGVISAIRELELGDGRPLVQVAIPIEPGSSGSPTLDLDGKVVSILAIKSGGAMGFGVPVNLLKFLLKEQNPIPMEKWLTIGALDKTDWESVMSGIWKQRAGIITAEGLGSGFGGRMLCLSATPAMPSPYELEVEVRMADESGAAGLVFHADGKNKHYGFYPTNESLRLTCFEGENVYSWNILNTVTSSAYRLNQWNRLRVKVEKNGKITCFVNDEPVIEVIDQSLIEGRVGLCKFRSPSAEFRNFKQARRIPHSLITQETRQKVRKITRNLAKLDRLPTEDYDRLIKLGDQVPQALLDQAALLKKQSLELNKLSKNIRERLSIDELARSLAHEDENSVDLLHSALLIARLENPNFDLEAYLKKAENLARQISSHFPQKASGEEKLKILVHQLFQEMGFHGSTLDYNHPSNSYINEVMDDREGLPITLSVLFIELANRLELPVTGLGLPGHFIAMYREDSEPETKEILVDPFGGKIVSRIEAEEITGTSLSDKDFKPANKRDIITRMLRNLIQSTQNDRDSNSRLLYINAILAIDPGDSYTRAMRAMILYSEERWKEALEDIDSLISQNPSRPEMAPLLEIRERLIEQDRSE